MGTTGSGLIRALGATAMFCGAAAADDTPLRRGAPPAPLHVRAASDVAPRVEALARAFEAQGGGPVKVRAERSAADLDDACLSGRAALVVLARDLTDADRSAGLEAAPLAFDAVAFVVRADHPAADLSLDELRRVCTGEAPVWADGTPIVLFDGRAGSAARETVASAVLGGEPFAPQAIVKQESSLLSALEQAPGGIGFTFLSGVRGPVKVLAVEGVGPTPQSVRSGAYPLSRPLVMATLGPASGPAADFIDFARSLDGQAALADAGLVPAWTEPGPAAASAGDPAPER